MKIQFFALTIIAIAGVVSPSAAEKPLNDTISSANKSDTATLSLGLASLQARSH